MKYQYVNPESNPKLSDFDRQQIDEIAWKIEDHVKEHNYLSLNHLTDYLAKREKWLTEKGKPINNLNLAVSKLTASKKYAIVSNVINMNDSGLQKNPEYLHSKRTLQVAWAAFIISLTSAFISYNDRSQQESKLNSIQDISYKLNTTMRVTQLEDNLRSLNSQLDQIKNQIQNDSTSIRK